MISHHVTSSSKNKSKFQALPVIEESAESPDADGAVDKVSFSPVDLEA